MLTRNDGKNVASLSRIWVKLLDEITDTKHVEGVMNITSDITLSGVWTPIEIVPGDASFQESQDDGDQGPLYNFSVQGVIFKDRETVTTTLAKYAGRKIAVIVEDRNDLDKRLIGEKGVYEYHARLSYTQVKEKTGGRNAYDFNISSQMHHPANYYEGSVVE